MPLTVKDILEKTFKKSFKGYDEDEVDKFLDQIIDEFKVLQNDNASMKEALDNEKERAQKVRETEETIMHTLVSAQKSAERIVKEATKKAETIIDSAEATSKKRIEQTAKDLADSQRRLDEIKRSAQSVAASFSEMIKAQSASFEDMYKNYFGDIEGGINIKALEKIDIAMTESLKGLPETKTEEKEIPNAPPKTMPAGNITEEDKDTKNSALMEFTEINRALSELEEGGENILQEEYPDEGNYKGAEGEKESMYDEYSWLYDNKGDKSEEVTIKDPKERAELESLIDEIVE